MLLNQEEVRKQYANLNANGSSKSLISMKDYRKPNAVSREKYFIFKVEAKPSKKIIVRNIMLSHVVLRAWKRNPIALSKGKTSPNKPLSLMNQTMESPLMSISRIWLLLKTPKTSKPQPLKKNKLSNPRSIKLLGTNNKRGQGNFPI